MTVIIPSNATEKQIEAALEKLNKASKKFDVDAFFGKMQWGQGPLKFQRDLRGE